MFDNSRYRAIIKNEQKKVRATTGLCCSSSICCDDAEANRIDNIELLSRTLIDNGNCASVSIDDTVLNARTADNNTDINTNSNAGFCGQNNRSFRNAGDFSADEQAELANAIRIQAEAEADERNNRRRNARNCAIRNRNNPARAGNTNVYRFVNQNFLDNALGRSKVRISDLDLQQMRHERHQEEVANILRRYGRNRGCGR